MMVAPWVLIISVINVVKKCGNVACHSWKECTVRKAVGLAVLRKPVLQVAKGGI
jgi:hypothetical protein